MTAGESGSYDPSRGHMLKPSVRNSSKLRGLAVAAVAAAILGVVWPVVGIASSGHAKAVAADSSTFTDPTGDGGDGGDVTTVNVSDDSSGKITFTATIANRPTLSDVDGIQAYFDTDKSSSTGGSGFEYEVGWIDGQQLLMHWDGATFADDKAASFTASYKDGKATFSINKSDFDGVTSFAFILVTTGDTGDSSADRAPDGTAVWTYPTAAPPPPPGPPPPPPPGSPPAKGKLKTVKPKLLPAVAGKSFSVPIIVTDAKTGKGIKGTVVCQGKLNGKTFRASSHVVSASGKASCTWRLPTSASDKILRGSITETYKRLKATRTFSVRIL
jgi:hypothetical protein